GRWRPVQGHGSRGLRARRRPGGPNWTGPKGPRARTRVVCRPRPADWRARQSANPARARILRGMANLKEATMQPAIENQPFRTIEDGDAPKARRVRDGSPRRSRGLRAA